MTFWPILGLVAGAIALVMLVVSALLPMHRGMRWPWVSRKDFDAIVDALQRAQRERYEANARHGQSSGLASQLGLELDGARSRIAFLTAELEAEKQRARRRSRRNGQAQGMAGPTVVRDAEGNWVSGPTWVSTVDMRDATAATDEPKVAGPSPAVLKAIRQAAGRDKPLARHLHAYAQEALDTGTSEREVIRMIQQGEQVAL